MKKSNLIIIGIIFLLIISIGVIFIKRDVKSENIDKNEIKELKRDIPEGNFNDLGKGTFFLSTPSGTSENGNIPVFFIEDSFLADGEYPSFVDIGISTRDFDGSKLSIIYVDGVSQAKEQLADTDTSLFVSEKLSVIGLHKVEVLQFDDNNNVITYKTASYEIKSK